MGLDITFTHRKTIYCPKCGEVVINCDEDQAGSSGRVWYELLESLGYYVPYDKVTEENNWYGKDMVLTPEQVDEVYQFLKKNDVYYGDTIMRLITTATYEDDLVVINADW